MKTRWLPKRGVYQIIDPPVSPPVTHEFIRFPDSLDDDGVALKRVCLVDKKTYQGTCMTVSEVTPATFEKLLASLERI